ncbi:trehalase-like [Lycorma delicatula]|uniref:trehalase-like n=1 Tax=Lycorma delicatula TaxID=130591 RepID=UPI003F51371C
MSSIYGDSKTFVDMKMKYNISETLRMFNEMMFKTKHSPLRSQLLHFINQTFDPPGSDFDKHIPNDWIEEPVFIKDIIDPNFKTWAKKLNALWKLLGIKVKSEVRINANQYSIIYVPNPVIVPGGRFREFYYWDSYWIMRGLLYCQMYRTVKGMLENFITMIQTYGFIPNGGRIYYTMRSQPPLFIPMVKSYVDFTGDKMFVMDNIEFLEKEFHFWMLNRTVDVVKNGKTYVLARYCALSSGPRPESYKQDVLTATQGFKTKEEIENLYTEIKSSVETGWDFSSRWFVNNGTNKGNLTSLKASSIIPVDLNAIIYWNANILAEFFSELKMLRKRDKYLKIAESWLVAVTDVLWHDDVGTWLDYDFINKTRRNYYFASNFYPLWTNCYYKNKKDYFVSKILRYLKIINVLNNPGGIPTTNENTGEQWDFPNAWPPLQYILITGLELTEDIEARLMAKILVGKWLGSNYLAYNSTDAMFEKYDATVIGGHGGGGEYGIQLGFGWTNGICLELLYKYGRTMTLKDLHLVGYNSNIVHGASLCTILFSNLLSVKSCHYFI